MWTGNLNYAFPWSNQTSSINSSDDDSKIEEEEENLRSKILYNIKSWVIESFFFNDKLRDYNDSIGLATFATEKLMKASNVDKIN